MDNAHRAFKDPLFAQFARIGKAVANPHRLELIDLLAQGERRVDDLATETGMSIANTSQHLQALSRAGLVESRRAGTSIYYHLADENVFRLWQSIRDLGTARLAEIDRLAAKYLGVQTPLAPLDAASLQRRLAAGEVVVLDVRPRAEFLAGHIPGARSMPIEELEQRLGEVPRDREIIAYCRGPYCLFSDEAVALLRAHGYAARRITLGFPDWRAAGLPTTTAEGIRAVRP